MLLLWLVGLFALGLGVLALMVAFVLPATASEGLAMIWVTVVVTLFLFVYLVVALLRPEWL